MLPDDVFGYPVSVLLIERRNKYLNEIAQKGYKKGVRVAAKKGVAKAVKGAVVIVIIGSTGGAGAAIIAVYEIYDNIDTAITLYTTLDDFLGAIQDEALREWWEDYMMRQEWVEDINNDPTSFLDEFCECNDVGSLQRLRSRRRSDG